MSSSSPSGSRSPSQAAAKTSPGVGTSSPVMPVVAVSHHAAITTANPANGSTVRRSAVTCPPELKSIDLMHISMHIGCNV